MSYRHPLNLYTLLRAKEVLRQLEDTEDDSFDIVSNFRSWIDKEIFFVKKSLVENEEREA